MPRLRLMRQMMSSRIFGSRLSPLFGDNRIFFKVLIRAGIDQALPVFVGQSTESDHRNFRRVAIVFQPGQNFKAADLRAAVSRAG